MTFVDVRLQLVIREKKFVADFAFMQVILQMNSDVFKQFGAIGTSLGADSAREWLQIRR